MILFFSKLKRKARTPKLDVFAFSLADETQLEHIYELLNSVIANPHIVTVPTEKKNEPSIELIRLNNEIKVL